MFRRIFNLADIIIGSGKNYHVLKFASRYFKAIYDQVAARKPLLAGKWFSRDQRAFLSFTTAYHHSHHIWNTGRVFQNLSSKSDVLSQTDTEWRVQKEDVRIELDSRIFANYWVRIRSEIFGFTHNTVYCCLHSGLAWALLGSKSASLSLLSSSSSSSSDSSSSQSLSSSSASPVKKSTALGTILSRM